MLVRMWRNWSLQMLLGCRMQQPFVTTDRQFFKMLELSSDSAISFPGIHPRGLKAFVFFWKQVHKNLCQNAHSCINTQKEATTPNVHQMITRLKKNVVYLYNAVLFSHKREQDTNTCYTMAESWKDDAKWEAPDRKDHILCDSIYMKCLD